MPRVTLSARSHNPADQYVDRFNIKISTQPGVECQADLTDAQVAHLVADPWITVTPAGKQSKAEAKAAEEAAKAEA